MLPQLQINDLTAYKYFYRAPHDRFSVQYRTNTNAVKIGTGLSVCELTGFQSQVKVQIRTAYGLFFVMKNYCKKIRFCD